MKLKKILILPLLTLSLGLSFQTLAFAQDVDSIKENSIQESKGATTDFKYWEISSKSRSGSRNLGSERYLTSYDTRNNGNTHTVSHTQSQTGSISIGLTVSKGAVGGSIGYTPGTPVKVSVSTTSGAYKKGTTVKSYVQNREDIWTLYQKEYETNHGAGIQDRPTGKSKTATVYKPAAPGIRFSPNPNY